MAEQRFDTARYSRVIALIERCTGNSEVGEMWTETHSFSPDAPLRDVLDWAAPRCNGRLMLTMDLGSPAPEAEKGRE